MLNSPIISRKELGMRLREARLAAGVETSEAEKAIRVGASMLSKLEYGRRGIKVSHVDTLGKLYGLDEQNVKELLDLAVRADAPAWWSAYRVAEHYQYYVGLETGADEVLTSELMYVPGLLQTEDYARAVHAASPTPVSDIEIERATGLRRARQARLHTRDHPLKVDAVINEAAMRCMVGGPEVMAAQALHLVDLMKQRNIAVQILPLAAGATPAMFGPYSLLRFRSRSYLDTVYLEHFRGVYLEREEQIALFTATHASQRNRAMGIEETRAWLVSLASELSAKKENDHGREVAQE